MHTKLSQSWIRITRLFLNPEHATTLSSQNILEDATTHFIPKILPPATNLKIAEGFHIRGLLCALNDPCFEKLLKLNGVLVKVPSLSTSVVRKKQIMYRAIFTWQACNLRKYRCLYWPE
ncbi:hypothetical protein KC19_6G092500 [Ceratodon purpureus]|uniref:Uncharacterized protein n=1 Tax=Ceratodon purpureus TaxID=3225 RepID=A0A8T0HCA5_CERPU|nr:hypothetical protein KC19_6G092500 [Ceratodon purpureus]